MTERSSDSSPRILIVEDESISAEIVTRYIRTFAYEHMGTVSSGEEAVELARLQRPDLVLMDIRLSGEMDGIEAGKTICGEMDIPVVYITAHGKRDLLKRAQETEAYGYLVKPVTAIELQTTIEIALHKHQADTRVRRQAALLEAITNAQNQFIAGDDPTDLFPQLLESLLSLTQSEYGFIDEAYFADDGRLLRRTHGLTNIAWDEATRRLYDEQTVKGFVFDNHENLAGAALLSGEPVIANDPSNDPRSGGLPPGHPAIYSFLGLPLYAKGMLVGVAGLANRPEGYDEAVVAFLEPYLATCATIIEARRTDQQRRQAERAVADGRALLQLVLDALPVGVAYVDSDGVFHFSNSTHRRWWGLESVDISGKRVAEVLGSQYHVAGIHEQVLKALAGQRVSYEADVAYADGGDRHVQITYVPHLQRDGAVQGFAALIVDLTDVKLMERALQERDRTLTTILDSSPVGISFAKDRRVEWANRAFRDLFGFESDEEFIGRHTSMLYDDMTEWEKIGDLYELARDGKSHGMDATWKRKDGTTFQGYLVIKLLDRADPSRGAICSLSDVTWRKRAEQQIRDSLKEKEVLLREIHHRVKNNLALVVSLLSLQSLHTTGKSMDEIFRDLQDRIRSMAVAHQMLYRSENLAYLYADAYVSELVDHLMFVHRTSTASISVIKNIDEITFGLDTAIPLGLLVTELVSNCLKHAFPAGARGEITVAVTKRQGDQVELLVRDNGVGLNEQIDLNAPRTLGLDLVGAFVQQLEGELTIHRHEGTEVRVVFPEHREASQSQ